MPRDISDPASLTDRQRAFADAYNSNGGDATAAYRAVYDCRNMNPSSVTKEASNLAHHPGISKLIGGTLEAPRSKPVLSVDPADLSKRWLLEQSMRTYAEATRSGQPGAAKNALELIGKLTGILVERKELRIIRSVEDLSDEELAAITGSKTIEGIAVETEES